MARNLKGYSAKDHVTRGHRMLNQYYHDYKNMLNLSNFDSQQEQQMYLGGDGDCNNDFLLTVDYTEFNRTVLAAKGTGFQPEQEAKRIKQIVKQEKMAKLQSCTDTGLKDSLFQRQYKALKAKEGVDITDKRDKFQLLREKQETENLIKQCTNKFKRGKKDKKRVNIEN